MGLCLESRESESRESESDDIISGSYIIRTSFFVSCYHVATSGVSSASTDQFLPRLFRCCTWLCFWSYVEHVPTHDSHQVFNPRLNGGRNVPLSTFLTIAKKTKKDISTTLCIPLLSSILHTMTKKLSKALIGRSLMTSETRHVLPISVKK